MKNHPYWGGFEFGGGGENRTPVQMNFYNEFTIHILFFVFKIISIKQTKPYYSIFR